MDFAADARTFQIDWAVYKQSHFLNDAEYEIISRFVQQRSEEAKAAFIGENGIGLFNVFISLLSKVSRLSTGDPQWDDRVSGVLCVSPCLRDRRSAGFESGDPPVPSHCHLRPL